MGQKGDLALKIGQA